MLPSGHLIHFQQQGVVGDCLVPGEQSLAQIDRGAHLILVLVVDSCLSSKTQPKLFRTFSLAVCFAEN